MKVLYKPEEAAEALGLGRATVYELMRAGDLESVTIGRARRVPAAAIEAYVQRLRDQQSGASVPAASTVGIDGRQVPGAA